MKFKDAPADAILIVANTDTGPVYARKLEGWVETGAVRHNAHWVTANGEFRGVCVITEDQDVVELHSTNNAFSVDDANPKRGTSKRTGRGSTRGRVPASSGDSSSESMG